MDKIEEKKLNKEEIAGIGVDVPGPVAADGSVPHTANLGWGYKAVTKELTELTGLPCKAGNDANVQPSAKCGWVVEKGTGTC